MGVYALEESEYGTDGSGRSGMLIPPGTTEQDLFVLIGLGSWNRPGVGPGGVAPDSDIPCYDPRMNHVATVAGRGDDSVRSERAWAVYVGHVNEGDPPIDYSLTAPYGGQFAQFVKPWGVVVRSDDGSPIEVAYDDIAIQVQPPVVPPSLPAPAMIPGLADAGDAALAIVAAYRSDTGVFADYVDLGRVLPQWHEIAGWRANYLGVNVYASDRPSIYPTQDLRRTDGTAGFCIAAIPLRGQTVTRQYPRDDGRGMSSAPRIYPPPKSGRVFGGYQ